MQYLLILVAIITVSVQGVFKKHFSLKGIPASVTYCGMVTLFALLFFVATGRSLVFDWEIVPYSLAFAAMYAGGTITSVLALRWGSLAITSLVTSYSLVLPTLYGLIFLNEPLGVGKLVGLAILCVSLFLVKGVSDPEKKAVSLKWVITLIFAFFTNGFCSIIQKEQQMVFDGIYNSIFMIIALAIAAVVCFVFGFFTERQHLKAAFRQGIVSAALCGVSNGITNYLVMVLVATVAASLLFPLISAGQLILAFVFSVALYKEKFLPRQLVGLGLGITAVVLLNM